MSVALCLCVTLHQEELEGALFGINLGSSMNSAVSNIGDTAARSFIFILFYFKNSEREDLFGVKFRL